MKSIGSLCFFAFLCNKVQKLFSNIFSVIHAYVLLKNKTKLLKFKNVNKSELIDFKKVAWKNDFFANLSICLQKNNRTINSIKIDNQTKMETVLKSPIIINIKSGIIILSIIKNVWKENGNIFSLKLGLYKYLKISLNL